MGDGLGQGVEDDDGDDQGDADRDAPEHRRREVELHAVSDDLNGADPQPRDAIRRLQGRRGDDLGGDSDVQERPGALDKAP